MRALLPAVALLAVAAAPAPVADPLAQRLIADSRAVTETSFGFERTTRGEGRDGSKVEKEVEIDRYDPTATPRWSLVSVDGRPPGKGKVREYMKQIGSKPAPNYGRVALLLAGARRTDATHFRLDRLPDGFLSGQGSGMMASHLVAELTVDTSGVKPFVSESHVFAPEPFRIMLIAKVDRFDALSRYRPGADGRPRIVAQDVTIAGSGPGMSGTQITHATFRPL